MVISPETMLQYSVCGTNKPTRSVYSLPFPQWLRTTVHTQVHTIHNTQYTAILPSTHTTIHYHHHLPRHLVLIHTTTTLTYPIYNHHIFHKTQHPTLQPAQTFMATLLPTSLTFRQAQTKQSNSSQHHTATNTHNKHSPHQPPYNTLNKVDNTQSTLTPNTPTYTSPIKNLHTQTLTTHSQFHHTQPGTTKTLPMSLYTNTSHQSPN